MELIDTHSHLFVEEFAEDLPEVVARAKEVGISSIYMPNIDSSTVESLLQVSKQYAGYCYPLVGLHPTSVDGNYREELNRLKPLFEDASLSIVGVGEVGLDLYWDRTYRNEQEIAFREQIEWALSYNLPLVIHSREAFDELYAIMCDYQGTPLRGIFHSFTGNKEEAEKLLTFENFMLGINGVLTFKKSTLPETLTEIPIERVVLETDSPYLAPVPCRGKRNETAYLRHTLVRMAEVYGMTPEDVSQKTTENALKVFKKGKIMV